MEILPLFLNGLGIFLCLTVVVTVHEWGHYLAARWAKVEVEAFAIGWGKVLFSWKPKKTEFRICLFPLGGYCKMKGDQDLLDAMSNPDAPFRTSLGSLFSASPWKRIIISAAGPLVNLVFAIGLFFAMYSVGYPIVGQEPKIQLASEVDGRTGTPAEISGLKTGDLVQKINGTMILTFQDLQETIVKSQNSSQFWTVLRDGASVNTIVTPRFDSEAKHSVVGIYPFYPAVVKSVAKDSVASLAGFRPGDQIQSIDNEPVSSGAVFLTRLEKGSTKNHSISVLRGTQIVELLMVPDETVKKAGWGLQFPIGSFDIPGIMADKAFQKSLDNTFELLYQMATGLIQLVTGQTNPLQALSGPIGIVKAGSEATATAFAQSSSLGWTTVVQFTAFLNLALVLMNLLPIPALDGGSIVVSLVEGIRKRRFGIKALIRYQQIGAVFILGLIIFTTVNDLGLFGG